MYSIWTILVACFAVCLLVFVGIAWPVIHTMKKAIADLDRLADSTRRAQAALDTAGQRMVQELEKDRHRQRELDEDQHEPTYGEVRARLDVSARRVAQELEDEHTAALIDEGEGRSER